MIHPDLRTEEMDKFVQILWLGKVYLPESTATKAAETAMIQLWRDTMGIPFGWGIDPIKLTKVRNKMQDLHVELVLLFFKEKLNNN